jgi:hypothetical protein
MWPVRFTLKTALSINRSKTAKPVKNRKPETKTGGLVVCSGSEEAVIFQKIKN